MLVNGLITAILPCYNEISTIEACVESILGQIGMIDRLELIVIDGMSDDGTRNVLDRLLKKHQNMKVKDNINRTIPYALNIGVRAARGGVIVRFDAHSTYPADYIVKGLTVLESSGADVVGGVFVNRIAENNWRARAIAVLTQHPFGVGASPFRTRDTAGPADSVSYGFFPRSTIEKYGLWDERLSRNQDTEYWFRIRKHGGVLYLDPDIKVYYFNKTTWLGLLKQGVWTGMWSFFTTRLHTGAMRLRHLVPAVFTFIISLLLVILAIGWATGQGVVVWLAFFALLVYLIPLVISTIHMCFIAPNEHRGAVLAPLILLMIPSYHFSYGFGFWIGWWYCLTGGWTRYLGAPVEHEPKEL